MKECVFFNDTISQNNWGCHATTFFSKLKLKQLGFNIKYNMTLHESINYKNIIQLVNNIKNNNIKYIFINGEGSLYEQHNIKGKNMIKFILLLNDVNCNIYLINSGFDLKSQQNISDFKKCLNNNINIYLREPISIKNFNTFYQNFKPIFQPDYLYLIYNNLDKYCNNDFLIKNNLIKKNYIVIGGNSNYYRSDRKPYDAVNIYINMIELIKKHTNKEIILYGSSSEEVGWLTKISKKTNIKFFHVKNTNWEKAFMLLSNAYLSISGRYHPTIMSIIGLTPSLMFSANHCKMNGVNQMFFPEQKVIDSHDIHNNFDYIINFVKETPKKYDIICNNIDIKLKKYYEIINKIQYSL